MINNKQILLVYSPTNAIEKEHTLEKLPKYALFENIVIFKFDKY